MQERVTSDTLGDEVEILVVEELVIVVQEKERHDAHVHHVLFVQWVVHIKVSHVVVPLWIMRVQEQSVYWELWTNSLANIKQVEHLLDRLVALLSHTSVEIKVRGNARKMITYL